MPLTKSDMPYALTAGLKTIFFEAIAQFAPTDYQKVATIVPSTKDTETYSWLGQSPSMREWVAERMPKGLIEQHYTIINKTWEASIGVDRAAIEDDQYGQVQVRVQDLAQKAVLHMNTLVFNLLRDGFATVCYDGQYFFDSDHSEGSSGTQDNVGTDALTAANLQTACQAIMEFKDDRGEYMGLVPDTLVVPPKLMWTALELLESVNRPDSSTNATNAIRLLDRAGLVGAGQLNLIVTPHCANATYTQNWFVLATKGVVKPLLLQDRMPLDFASLEADSEAGFMRDEYLYGVRARYNAGYGLWQCAYGNRVS